MADVDYYALLGIPRHADAVQIKRAYQRQARVCHPDIAGPEGADAFRLITRAYQTLMDPDSRKEYDQGFIPITSIPELYERHREGRKIMQVMLPTAPAAKQIGPDLCMTVTVPKNIMIEGGTVVIKLPNEEQRELILQIPSDADRRAWCRLPHLGGPGRNGADAGDLWIQLKPERNA